MYLTKSFTNLEHYPHEKDGRQLSAEDVGRYIKISLYSNPDKEFRHDYDLLQIEGVITRVYWSGIIVLSDPLKNYGTRVTRNKWIHSYSFPKQEKV